MAESYTERLQRRAVSFVVERGMSIREAAVYFDVTSRSLKNWVRDHLERTGPSDPEVKSSAPEVKSAPSSVSPPASPSVSLPPVEVPAEVPDSSQAMFLPVVIEDDEESDRMIPLSIRLPNRCVMHLKLTSLREVAELLQYLELP